MRFDPLFKNTNLAWSREKEGKKGWQGGREASFSSPRNLTVERLFPFY